MQGGEHAQIHDGRMRGRARDRARHGHWRHQRRRHQRRRQGDRSRPGQLHSGRDQRGRGPATRIRSSLGVYHQSVQIRTNGITCADPGAFRGGTVLVPPKFFPKTLCNGGFGPTGVCVLAKSVNPKTGAVLAPVRNDRVTTAGHGFPGNGVFGYGRWGLSVTRVVAINDAVTASRASCPRGPCSPDSAIGNTEAGFYVGDSRGRHGGPDDEASGNQFGIFIWHARHAWSTSNVVSGNCQGSWPERRPAGGVGNAAIISSTPSPQEQVPQEERRHAGVHKGGGIPPSARPTCLGTHNSVTGNVAKSSSTAASSR